MAPQIKNVIIIGAGGNLGGGILPVFLKSNFKVSVLSRPESKSTFPDSVNVIRSSYESSELKAAFKGQEAVISLIGSNTIAEQHTVIDAAVAAGVKWFIPSEFGSDTRNPEVTNRVPIFQAKIDTVKYLKEKEKDGMSWTAIITGIFIDWATKVGFTEFDLKERKAKIWDGGDVKFSGTNLSTIGKALVNLLEKPENLEKGKNKYVVVSSFTTSQNEMLKTFENITGDKWTTEKVDGKKAGEEALEKLKKGDFSMIKELILAPMLGAPGYGDMDKAPGGTDNDWLLPDKQDNLEDTLKRVVKEVSG